MSDTSAEVMCVSKFGYRRQHASNSRSATPLIDGLAAVSAGAALQPSGGWGYRQLTPLSLPVAYELGIQCVIEGTLWAWPRGKTANECS
jgi:hypothetical protein